MDSYFVIYLTFDCRYCLQCSKHPKSSYPVKIINIWMHYYISKKKRETHIIDTVHKPLKLRLPNA